jgi:hypothetical protein
MYDEKLNWNKSSTRATQDSRTKIFMHSAQDYEDAWLKIANQGRGLEQIPKILEKFTVDAQLDKKQLT